MAGTERDAFARRWADELTGTSYVSMGRDELVAYLRDLTDQLVTAALAAEFDPRAGHQIGAALVAAHFTNTSTLSHTLTLIIEQMPGLLGSPPSGADVASRVASLAGAIAAGYADALRGRSVDEQDSIYRAALRARKQAVQALASSEARFRQVFYSSSLGLVISEPAGAIARCNRSLENILGYPPGELLGREWSELFFPRDWPVMQDCYQNLTSGRAPRLRGCFPLRRADGEPVWVNLDISALPNGSPELTHIVTMVDDVTDLQLLEQRLHHQTLHDPGTGLPNRQYLLTHLERTLANLDPSATVTLFHLDLDGFSAINDGLGQHLGDQMLEVIARRLDDLFADRRGMVARLGDDEYAIFLEPGEQALDVDALTKTINTALAEPHYVGDDGLALTATIGVVQRQVGECVPEEFMRDASATLRRVRGQGPQQWAPFDADTDVTDRTELQLAAAIPGAQEMGQLQVTYQPVVTLAERALVGIEAALCWNHPQHGLLAHERCAAAAERTGAVHAIGEWLLRTAAEQALIWRQRGAGDPIPLMINLTPAQARDPELIATVTAVLTETGLAPQMLELRASVAAIRAATGEFAGEGGAQAEDNLRVLIQLGVRAGVHDFAGGIGGLRCRAELPLSSVRLAPLITQQAAGGSCPILTPAMRTSIQSLRAAGIDVLAYPVDTALQAAYCTDLGVNWALGALYGPPGPPEHSHSLLPRGPG